VAAAPVFADMAALAAWTGQFICAHGTKFDTSGEFNQYLYSNPRKYLKNHREPRQAAINSGINKVERNEHHPTLLLREKNR